MNGPPARPRSRRRGRIRLLACGACVAALAAASAIAPSAARAATICSSQTGSTNGYFYSFWTAGSGSVCMNLGSGGNYSTSWSGVGDFVAGVGWNPGAARTITYSGSFNPSGDAYLSVYGWSTNPLVEYYITDDWSGYNPGSGATFKGTVSSDGGTYNIYEDQRVNQPSIIGTATFNQYWAVRTSPRVGGTITVGNFFNAWASHGMNLGTLNYQILATEAFNGGSGNSNITVGASSGGGGGGGGGGATGPIVAGDNGGKCVDNNNGAAADGNKVQVWDCDGYAPAQSWTMASNGTVQIDGGCMDITGANYSNGTLIEWWPCNGGANQQWQASNGELINPASGKCLDDPDWNTANGTQLDLWTCNGGSNQQWHLP
jgi:endo-1,4-beta-xylanase